MLVMFSTYGLAFWYGSTLVDSGIIPVGSLLTAFFAVLVGAFSLAQVCFMKTVVNIDFRHIGTKEDELFRISSE